MKKTLSLAVAVLAGAALAQNVPSSVNFNARLSDTTGAPVSGTRTVQFRLFDQLSGGTALWQETSSLTFSADGLVSTELGATTPLTTTQLDGRKLYLEVQVDTSTLAPRIGIVSVPYAIRSSVAATALSIGTLTAAQVQRRVTGTCAAGSAVSTVNADGTVLCETFPTSSAGDITGVLTGPGLTGGGTSGSVTVSLTPCTNGQVLKAGSTTGSWSCAPDANTTYTAGATSGLTVTGTALSLASCPTGQVLKAGATAGTWACAADTGTTYTAGANSGLVLTGTSFGLVSTCTAGQVLKAGATAGSWACANDNGLTGTGGVNQLAYFSGASTVTSDPLMVIDPVNNRLGLETSAPTATLTVAAPGSAAISVAGTASGSAGSTTLAGAGTSFTATLQAGDVITTSGCSSTAANNQVRTVTAIASATSLTVNEAWTTDALNCTITFRAPTLVARRDGYIGLGGGREFRGFDFGRIGNCTGGSAGSSGTVTFLRPFISTPSVVATPRSTTGTCNAVRTGTVNTTSFTWQSFAGTAAATCDCIDWVAFGG